jgi:phage host-nuclease inhibitor protein Gam
VGEFDSLQIAVKTWMLAGRGLSEVEEELINPGRLSTDEKAVLWLLAWSMLPPSHQLAEVEAHIELLSRSHVA